MAYSEFKKVAIYGYVAVIKSIQNCIVKKVSCLGCFYKNHIKVSKISQNIPIVLIWVKKMVKKGYYGMVRLGLACDFERHF